MTITPYKLTETGYFYCCIIVEKDFFTGLESGFKGDKQPPKVKDFESKFVEV